MTPNDPGISDEQFRPSFAVSHICKALYLSCPEYLVFERMNRVGDQNPFLGFFFSPDRASQLAAMGPAEGLQDGPGDGEETTIEA
jgi:hypothetical protein